MLVSGRATVVIAAVTALASVLVWFAVPLEQAALAAGFIPARATLVLEGAVPFLLTPLTATLIHGDFLHLAMNLLILVYCGRMIEAALGPAGMVALYVGGAYAGALAGWLAYPGSVIPSIGASGAISALVGGYALLYGQSRMRSLGPVPARVVQVVWLAAAWIAIQALIAAVQPLGGARIDIFAHIGGFIAGLGLARPLLGWRFRRA